MVKVRIIPNGEVVMPGSEKPMPAAGAVVELTTYWQRLAEAGTVRIAPDAGQPADKADAAGAETPPADKQPADKKGGSKAGK